MYEPTSKNFFVPLNFPSIADELEDSVYSYIDTVRQKHGQIDWLCGREFKIPTTVFNIFRQLKLTVSINKTLLFTQSPYQTGKIHLDNVLADPGLKYTSRSWAINWVFGGPTIMEWYEYRGQNTPLPGYVHYSDRPVSSDPDPSDCHLLFRSEISGANLINVGEFHRANNPSAEPRFCISACSLENISYNQMIDLLSRKKGLIREI